MDLSSKNRYLSLDIIRAFAIILMVVFHLCFNLNHFKFIDINIYNDPFWYYFRFFIVSIFLLCFGTSLYISNHNGINIKKAIKRFRLLFIASFSISGVTYFIFPNSWIYFGVLHFISFASIFGLFFVYIPLISLFFGLSIVVLWSLDIINMHWLFNILSKPLFLPVHTEDLAPLTPWFGIVLIGIFLGAKGVFTFYIKENILTKNIAILGKNSLLIYIVHQPILFGTTFLIYKYL